MDSKKSETTLFIITSIFVLAIASFSFIWSFSTVEKLAIELGASSQISWILPTVVDAAILVFSIVRMYAKLTSIEKLDSWSFAGIILATSLSILFNTVDANGKIGHWLDVILHISIPVFLFAAIEFFMFMVENYARKYGSFLSLGQVLADIGAKKEELETAKNELATTIQGIELSKKEQLEISKKTDNLKDNFQKIISQKEKELTSHVDNLRKNLMDNLEKEIASLTEQKMVKINQLDSKILKLKQGGKKAKKLSMNERRKKVLVMANSGKTQKEISQVLSVSVGTIKNDLAVLNGQIKK